MIADFEDFCLHLYVLVDDLWARIGDRYRRPGPAPACSDRELITMVLAGECRGGEALEMLQAMNTGHDGSMTTLHANTPRDAIARVETNERRLEVTEFILWCGALGVSPERIIRTLRRSS